MQLINSNIESKFKNDVLIEDVIKASDNIEIILDILYLSIPDNNRISYGKVYTIKISAKYIYENFSKNKEECFAFAENIYCNAKDYRVKGVALGIISFYGKNNFNQVLKYFLKSADGNF